MKNPFSNMSGFFQQIGKSLMLPVAILPVAGILLGVGTSFLVPADQNPSLFPNIIFQLMSSGGSVIFANLALIFAIGVALGFTENDGAAALSASDSSLLSIRLNEVAVKAGPATGLSLRGGQADLRAPKGVSVTQANSSITMDETGIKVRAGSVLRLSASLHRLD